MLLLAIIIILYRKCQNAYITYKHIYKQDNQNVNLKAVVL